MERKESYIHTRNYGCRLRRYTMDGVDMLSLENQRIKVVVALGKGADIVELVHKKTDTDVLWHSFNPLKNVKQVPTNNPEEGNFMDLYEGGWQELFPTHGSKTLYEGGEIGVHGEAAIYPWDCTVLEDTPECIRVHLTLYTVRSPFLLEKTMTLRENDATLYMHQKATNLGMTEQRFMWGHHPAFGFPFLDSSVRLHVPGQPTVTVDPKRYGRNTPFDEKTSGPWPFLPDRNGDPVDMGRVWEREDKLYMEYGLTDLSEGRYELINHRTGLGIRMTWDKNVFRNLWVWALYCGLDDSPWFGRAYLIAVEPWSSMPGNYELAGKAGTLLHLAPGASMEADINAQLFETEEEK